MTENEPSPGETTPDAGTTGTDRSTPADQTVDSDSSRRVRRVMGRELRTVARTRTFAALGVAFAAILIATAWVGGGVRAGFVPAVVDLLTPLELLVPVVTVAFGYRAIVGDRERGELDVLTTYPVTARELVLGIYAGRAVGVLVVVVVPLLLVGAAGFVVQTDPTGRYASHVGADSPILFARFVVLTALFALVVLAVVLAMSALVDGARSALALALGGLVVLLVGLDLAIAYGFASNYVGDGSLVYTLAISPLSAYRGLVFETVVLTAAGTGPQAASPIASLFGLVVWAVVSLLVAVKTL
ncbi:ABC transporter permease [Natrarchaeobius sp. A-rgal3]|uniref:ABC transporter permease n=1 Tax=Natrarchaeobius versutus TaxID=1679078 RepID=UPI00350EC76E